MNFRVRVAPFTRSSSVHLIYLSPVSLAALILVDLLLISSRVSLFFHSRFPRSARINTRYFRKTDEVNAITRIQGQKESIYIQFSLVFEPEYENLVSKTVSVSSFK